MPLLCQKLIDLPFTRAWNVCCHQMPWRPTPRPSHSAALVMSATLLMPPCISFQTLVAMSLVKHLSVSCQITKGHYECCELTHKQSMVQTGACLQAVLPVGVCLIRTSCSPGMMYPTWLARSLSFERMKQCMRLHRGSSDLCISDKTY